MPRMNDTRKDGSTPEYAQKLSSESAGELGIRPLPKGPGEMTSREAGNVVKGMIEAQKRQMARHAHKPR